MGHDRAKFRIARPDVARALAVMDDAREFATAVGSAMQTVSCELTNCSDEFCS